MSGKKKNLNKKAFISFQLVPGSSSSNRIVLTDCYHGERLNTKHVHLADSSLNVISDKSQKNRSS